MDPRQKAALSMLTAEEGALGDLDPLKLEREGLDKARAEAATKKQDAGGTAGAALGALIGAYFGVPQAGAALGRSAGKVAAGGDVDLDSLIGAGSNMIDKTKADKDADMYELVRAAYLGGK